MSMCIELLPEDVSGLSKPTEFEIVFDVTPGRPGNMNWGGLPSPPEPPTVEIDEILTMDGQPVEEVYGYDVGDQIHEIVMEDSYESLLECASSW